MTPELRKLLTEWLNWAMIGGPTHPIFLRQHGLCINACLYGGNMAPSEANALTHIRPKPGPAELWVQGWIDFGEEIFQARRMMRCEL